MPSDCISVESVPSRVISVAVSCRRPRGEARVRWRRTRSRRYSFEIHCIHSPRRIGRRRLRAAPSFFAARREIGRECTPTCGARVDARAERGAVRGCARLHDLAYPRRAHGERHDRQDLRQGAGSSSPPSLRHAARRRHGRRALRWRRNERAARRPRGSDLVCRAEEARRVHRPRRSEEHLGSPLRGMHRQPRTRTASRGFRRHRRSWISGSSAGDSPVGRGLRPRRLRLLRNRAPRSGGAVSREIRSTTARIPFLAGTSGAVSTLGDPVECAIWHAKRSAVELWGLHGGERASQVCALPNWQCRLLRFGLVVCGSSTLRISVPRRAIERVRGRSVAG